MNISAISFKDIHHSLLHSIIFRQAFVLYLLLFQGLFKVQVSQVYLRVEQLFELLIKPSILFSKPIALHILGFLDIPHSFLIHRIYSLINQLHLLLLLINHHPQDQMIMKFMFLRTTLCFLLCLCM